MARSRPTAASAKPNTLSSLVDVVLNGPFMTAEPAYHARLAQLVYTATAAAGLDEVRVGGKTYTRANFGPEPYTEPKPPARKLPAPANPKAVQNKLAALGYLPSDAVTGKFDYRTMQAVIAFQAWSGLQRDGVVGPMTLARLKVAGRPRLPLPEAKIVYDFVSIGTPVQVI